MIFGTLVKVISGFYLGCVGTIIGDYPSFYVIELSCISKNAEKYGFRHDVKKDIVKEISQDEYIKYLRQEK